MLTFFKKNKKSKIAIRSLYFSHLILLMFYDNLNYILFYSKGEIMEKDKIALLIDAENISYRYVPKIMDMLNKYTEADSSRTVTHKLGFANWQIIGCTDWETALKKNAIKQKHTPSYSKGKNGTDISLVIYAMEAAFTKNIDTFVIVTGDSDFTDLVYKLNELGKTVIVCSSNTVASSLRNAGNDFWEIIPDPKPVKEVSQKATLPKKEVSKSQAKPSQKTSKQKPSQKAGGSKEIKDKQLIKSIAERSFLNRLREKEDSVDMSTVYSEMLNMARANNKELTYKSLGHKKLKTFFQSFGSFEVYAIDKGKTITYMLKWKQDKRIKKAI